MLDGLFSNPTLLVILATVLCLLFPNNPLLKAILSFVTQLKDGSSGPQPPVPPQAGTTSSETSTIDHVYNALKKLDALECDCPETKQAISTIFANRDKFREVTSAK